MRKNRIKPTPSEKNLTQDMPDWSFIKSRAQIHMTSLRKSALMQS